MAKRKSITEKEANMKIMKLGRNVYIVNDKYIMPRDSRTRKSDMAKNLLR